MKDKKALVEAALFVSENPLTLGEISKISGITSKKTLKEILNEISKELDFSSRGIELALTNEGYQLQVKDHFLKKVASLTAHSDISRGGLRTLSIVALKQPILQSEIVKVQGNKAYNYIKRLEKKKLIRTEKAGRTRKIYTTKEFERYFGKDLEQIQERLKLVEGDSTPEDETAVS